MAHPAFIGLSLFLIHSPIKISAVEGSRSQVQLDRVFLDLQSLSSHAAKYATILAGRWTLRPYTAYAYVGN